MSGPYSNLLCFRKLFHGDAPLATVCSQSPIYLSSKPSIRVVMPIIKPSGRRRLRARDSNADLSSCLLSPVNKRLNFSFDAGDASAAAAATGSVVAMNNNHVVVAQADSTTANTCDPSSSSSSSTTQFYMDMDPQLIMLDEAYLRGDGAATAVSGGFDNFSPCRTRSGCVYESGLKKQRFRVRSSSKRVKTSAVSPAARVSGVRSRACSGQSGTGSIADCSENGSDADENCAALSEMFFIYTFFYTSFCSYYRCCIFLVLGVFTSKIVGSSNSYGYGLSLKF